VLLISNKTLKFIAREISWPFSHLVNLSMKLNYVPPGWNEAKVVPLFKSGDATNPTNFRPISLLATFSKILEKAVHKQVYSFLNSHNLIYKHRYGFCPSHSCEHFLTKLMSSVVKA
jgi:hypothetical protein